MAGYSRQSAASIVPTAVVRATPLNDEFNTLRDAFVVATGHKHDGTSTEGAYVPLISDTNSRNKVVVDSANNRISLFINVSSAAVEQLRLIDGAILPVTDNDIDLGSSSFEFKDLFIDGTANIDSLVADTAAISGGTINSAVIGGTTPAAGTFTTITATVSATIPSVAITGGTINNTIIGATTPAAGTFTNLTVNTAATIASAAISAGTINNTVIGGTTPQAVTGTTITANTGFVGALTGNVTGNVTASSGTSTFNNATVNGTLSATLTGNVNASSGTSTFNNVTISGTLNMDGATAATITNLSSPVNNSDAATKGYVDTAISNLIDTAPGTLDTLNELAAALGDDPNFATTVTNSIATKLSLSGGTMTGAIAMGTNKITGMGDPTSAQDAATKTYVDTQRDTRLALSGGTMSGTIAMGTNKITGLGDPTSNQDAATKIYVDGILGSATSAAASAAAAATSASNAATSASNASTSATNAASSASAAAASAAAAAASYDSFDDRYLGVKTSDPSLDNDGNALVTGAIYFNSTAGEMRVWTGSAWASTLLTTGAQTFTGVKTFSSNPILDAGTANGVAYLNGSKVLTTGSALTFDGNGALGVTSGSNVSLSLTSTGGYSQLVLSGGSSANYITSDDPLSFYLAGSEQMRLTSTGLGIGTSSPAYKLDVSRGASDGFTARIGRATGTAFYMYSDTTNSYLTTDTSLNNSLSLSATGNYIAFTTTNGTERARITSTGDVGIGTSSPNYRLDVAGTANATALGTTLAYGTGGEVYSAFRFNNSSFSGGNSEIRNIVNGAGSIGSAMAFFTSQTGSGTLTERLRIDNQGNLGLGVTPSASWDSIFKAIQIGSASYLSIAAQTTATARGSILWNAVGSGDESFVYRNTGDPANRFMVGSGFYAWYTAPSGTAGNTISFGDAKMTLDASGNFMVGATSSSAIANKNIDVNGTGDSALVLRVGGTTTAYLYSIASQAILGTVGALPITFNPNGTERARISSDGTFRVKGAGTAGSTDAVQFAGSAPASSLTLDASGNLGVGTTSPSTYAGASGQLVVYGGVSTTFTNNPANITLVNNGTIAAGLGTGINFSANYNGSAATTYALISGIRENATSGSAAGALVFGTRESGGGVTTERARIDSAGNLGLGVTPSAWSTSVQTALQVYTAGVSGNGGGNTASRFTHGCYLDGSTWKYQYTGVAPARYEITGPNAGSTHSWSIAAGGTAGDPISFTQAMTLDASGRLVIGDTTATQKLTVVNNNGTYGTIYQPVVQIGNTSSGGTTSANTGLGAIVWSTDGTATPVASIEAIRENPGAGAASGIAFRTGSSGGGTERARITSGGYFKASNDGTYLGSTGGYHELRSNTDNNNAVIISSNATNGTQYGLSIRTTNDQNDAIRDFLECQGGGVLRAQFRTNGGLANYSANDVNLSDQRLKTDAQPAGNYLDKICAIPIKTFLYKDQTDTERNLGVMAQDVDAVAPELIDHNGFGKAPEGESPYLAVYQTDLQYALMKCIQELKAQNDDLRARVAQLEAK